MKISELLPVVLSNPNSMVALGIPGHRGATQRIGIDRVEEFRGGLLLVLDGKPRQGLALANQLRFALDNDLSGDDLEKPEGWQEGDPLPERPSVTLSGEAEVYIAAYVDRGAAAFSSAKRAGLSEPVVLKSATVGDGIELAA